MKNLWKMVGVAVIGGVALGYCCYQETYIPETESNLEERVQYAAPYTKPRQRPRKYSTPLTPENQDLEEARDKIRAYAEQLKRNQEMSSSGNPGRFLYGLPSFSEEEENEERPAYDLPQEKRTPSNIATSFNGALDAKDYRVAASYIANFEEFALPEEKEQDKRAITYVVVSGYNDFLNEIIQDCQKYGYDYDSIFRKVIWMDFFLINHQEILPMVDPETRRELDLLTLIQKGEQAIQAISDCQPHE